MRIVPLVVFCVATYVARVTDGGETTRTTSENGVKNIFRQKSEAIRDEIFINDEVTNKRRGQSLLINRFDDLSRNRKITNDKLKEIKQKRKKRARDSDIARRRNTLEINDINEDVEEENTLLTETQGLPVWQVSEPMIATIDLNSTINSMIEKPEVIKIPQSGNLNFYRSSNKAISRLRNSHELSFNANVPDKNLIFSKFQNSKSVRSPVFTKLINKVPLFVSPKIPVNTDSNSRPSQEFEWRENSRNIKQDSPNLTESNERFLLVPVSKDLYVLKNIEDNSEKDGTIISNCLKLLRRNKIKENATSAIVSFKAHMHYDVKDVGRAYLHHRDSNNNHRLFDTDYLSTDLDFGISEENMEKFTTLSYPNFLYPGVAFQTRPDLNVIPEIFDQQVTLSVSDYISLNAELIPYNSSIFSSTSSAFDIPNYDVSSYLKENDCSTSYLNTDHFFLNNAENILNNLDVNEDDIESRTSMSSEFGNEKSTHSNDFNYNNKFIDETLFNNYTTVKLDSFLNVEDYTTSSLLLSVTDEWSLKKEQSNVGNPRALLKIIEPLSSELTKLLTAVKLVNQSISNVQNRLCDKRNVVRSARIERESKERKTTNIAELINSKDDFDLFIESFNNRSLDKKQIKIKEKNIKYRTSNDVEFKRKFNDYFLNKLTTPLHKRESSISNDREMCNNHRNADKDSRLNFLLNKKRDLTTRYSGMSKVSNDEEKTYSSMDLQSHSFREVTAYLDVLRLLNVTKKPHVELTDVVTESLISITEFFVTTVTILYYPIERSLTTTSGTPTIRKEIDYEVVQAISLAQLSVTLSAFTITMPTTSPQLYTTELPIFPIDEILEKTTLTVAMLTEVTEISTIKLTTESIMLLTPFLEGITNITLRISIPAVISTTLFEEASTTEEEIVKSTLMTEVTQSFFTETSISLYITSTVSSFTTVETAESTIQITIPFISVLTSLIVTKKPRITTPMEDTTSVTERMITIISPTIMTTKSTVIFTGENTTLHKAITLASTAKTEETSLFTEEVKTTSIESTTTTEYTTILSTTQFVPTQVTKGTETSTITVITSSPTISKKKTEMILSTLTEIAITILTPERESPVTQIEKTITTEEITTETPTIIETSTITKIPIISETSVLNETSTSSTTQTTIEVSSTKSIEILLTTIKTTITKILTPSEISTIINTLPFKLRTTIKPSMTIEISTLIESPITTEIQTTIKTSMITETTESSSISSIIVTTVKTIPTTLLIMTKRPATTSIKITVPITTLTTFKLTTTMPSLVINTTLSETPCTISTTFLTEEIEATTSSITSIISTISTIKTLPTTLSILITTKRFLNTSVAINKTLFTTIFTTFETTRTIETLTLPMTPVTTTSSFEATPYTTLTSSIMGINTTLSEITFNKSLTGMTKESTLTTTLTEVVSTSLVELTTEERIATWITIEEITITEATTLRTYVPLSTTMFLIEIMTKTTLFAMETVTAISSEEISMIKEVTALSFTTITEEFSLTTEITPVTLLPITEKPEQITILKTEMTFTPLSEFTLSVFITTETSATMPEVISVLSETISEEGKFTTILTSPLYTLESSTLFTEIRIQPTISTLTSITEEIPEAEIEYYVAKEPFYEEEYEEYEEYEEEYDTEIPTDKWYYYEEYETTMKSKTTMTTSTEKYTKLPKKTATSPPFDKGTSSYETRTLEFTMYPTTSTLTHTDVTFTTTTTKEPYTYIKEEFTLTSALKTSTKTIENIMTTEVRTMFITSITSKEEESTTMALTFGSTEEYTLLPSTIFEIITKPLEYLTIPPKYAEPTSKFFTPIWHSVTAPKFITKPEETSMIELEGTSTKTEFSMETLTFFFVSSTLTTLSEREAIGVTTAFSEMETEVIILATKLITKEEIAPYTTIVSETEFITTRQTTIGQEEQRKQILQLLEELLQREREVAEREEKLKEKERQWEEKKYEEMIHHEKEKIKNITTVNGTTVGYITVTSTADIKITSLLPETFSLTEIITTSTETTSLYITEESIFATNVTERTEETMEESTFSTYMVEVTEETAILYITEESTSVTYITKEIEEMCITNYTTLTPYVTVPIVDLYNISLVSIKTTIEEMYTTYGIAYLSEFLFTSPTMMFTSPIIFAIDEFTTLSTATFNISLYEMGATSIEIPTHVTTESYTTSRVTLCSVFPFTLSTMTTLTGLITSIIGITSSISVITPISYTTEEIVEIYSESSVTSPAFIKTTTAITIKEMRYDEEIESLKEKLREKERELEKKEKMLLEREKQLEKNIMKFELYMKQLEEEEMRTLIALSEKPIVTTSLSTPMPPTEKTQVVTQIKEKKENQTTTKMATSPYKTTKVKDIEEERYIPEKIATEKIEEEIVTKRICLNVLENTTMPFVAKKVCLPYFPEKNREQNSVNRVNRKLLSFKNTREIRESKFRNFPSHFRYKQARGKIETTRKINNLQLSHHEWLSNEVTKPMRYFKGFIRIYRKKEKSPKNISTTINTQEHSNLRDKTFLYEQPILDPYENVFPKIFTLDDKKYRKRNAYFIKHNLISARRNNISDNNDKCIEKRYVLPAETNRASVSNKKSTGVINEKKKLDEKEDESYTVNVLHLSYNKDRETHEIISVKPNGDELTMIISESNDVTKFEEDGKIATSHCEEKSDLQEGDDLQEKKQLEEDDSFQDMLENYMNYEECTTSITTCDGEDRRKMENEAKLLDQIWPTEKNTMYHLGGTRFWELEVTEPSVAFGITTDESKTVDVSVRTTCLYVILKDKISTNAKTKRNIYKLRISNDDLTIAKTRKLCGVNENNESKNRIIKNSTHIRDKTRKKQSEKSHINSHSSKNCTDSCIVNKKKMSKTITTRTITNHYSQAKSNGNKKNDEKMTNNEKKKHDYLNCICDIVNVIENIKSILNRISFSLDEIKELNCSVYKETQDKIVISMDSDAEEAKEFPQPHYNIESLKGQKYIKLEELEDNFKSDLELGNDHDIISLPGLNLNLPCNQDGDGITWLSSISRPSYVWKRTDGIAIFGFVAENGDLELRNVNAKDTGNYTCIATYMGPETEEPVETIYEVHLQVVTLPRYIIYGENRYYTRSCDERDLDILVTYLPVKLSDIICEGDICNAYILTPSCSRSQITVNVLLLPSHIVKLMTIDPKRCNVFCLKAIQDKLSLILSKNLQILLGKTNYLIMSRDWFRSLKSPRLQDGKEEGQMDLLEKTVISACFPAVQLDMVFMACIVFLVIWVLIARTEYRTVKSARPLWSSFSAIMITLASLGVMLSIFLLCLWIICCAKKKFYVKQITSIIPQKDAFEENPIEEQSLIKDVSENEDQQRDNEFKAKKKKKKFYLSKKRRKQNERGKYEKIRVPEDEWGSHRIKNTPIICPDSYRSHEDYNNYYSKQSYRKGPRLPECDFDT